MVVHKHMRATLLLTVLAVVLAVFSLTLPWYTVQTRQVYDSGYTDYTTYEFHLGYYSVDSQLRGYDDRLGYGEVGSLLGVVSMVIVFWSLMAIVYIAIILPSAGTTPMGSRDGFLLGWALIAMSVVTVTLFAVRISGLYSAFVGNDTLTTWGPSLGWYTALVACVIQVIAVMARNVPILRDSFVESETAPPEEVAHGDLPAR